MSTPPLSRSSSRSSLDDLVGSDDKEPKKHGGKKPGSNKPGSLPVQGNASSKPPSTSHRPLQRAGTWSKGVMPTEPEQRREPERSSDPRWSPRSAPNDLPPPPKPGSGPAPASSQPRQAPIPSTSTSHATAKVNPGKQEPDNRVVAGDLSQKVLSWANISLQAEGRLAPERIGELLLAVESKGGAIRLAGDKINRILRGGLVIHDVEPPSGTGKRDINVIRSICEPFMFEQLDTPELEKSRKKFISQFSKLAQKFDDLSTKVHAREWTRFSPLRDLMDPIMKPMLDILCGPDHKLASSGLSDQIKKLLLSIDKHVIAWFGNNGTGKPADLYLARKSALVGFLSTRSLGYVWYTKSSAEQTLDNRHLTMLLAYMNSFISTQIDGFVTDILLAQTDQPVEARKYIEVLTRKTLLKSKPSVPSLALGSTLAGKGVLSPRAGSSPVLQSPGRDQTDAAKKADKQPERRAGKRTGKQAEKQMEAQKEQQREQQTEKQAEKQAKARLMKMRVEHARFIDKMAADAGLDKIDYQCYQHVKEVVVNMSQRGFENFSKHPVKSIKKYADGFYALPVNHKRVRDGLPAKVINALDALDLKLVGNPFEEAGTDDLRQVPSAAKRGRSAEPEPSSETEPSDESEVGTESSEEEPRS